MTHYLTVTVPARAKIVQMQIEKKQYTPLSKKKKKGKKEKKKVPPITPLKKKRNKGKKEKETIPLQKRNCIFRTSVRNFGENPSITRMNT